MIKFLKDHKKAAWFCFFGLVYAGLLAWKFWPLVSMNQILPGNDTLGHIWAFHEFFQSLSAGHFWDYSPYWFGGMPLFQFYAPLGFLFMSGVYAAIGRFVSQFLVFRWYVFLTFAVFPVPFYFFVKAYLGRKAAYASLPVGLLLVFYPPFFNFMGLGAAASIVGGLFDQMLAVDLLLFYLVALKKLADSDSLNWKWIAWGGVALALVFLAHTLTSIMAGVLTFIIGLYYVRRWFKQKLFWNFGLVIVLGILLSSFWLFPFVANLKFTSAEAISTGSFLSSPLDAFAPFHLNDIWNGGAAAFSYAWLLIWIPFLIGLAYLIKEKRSLFPIIILTTFLCFGLDYFDGVFPGLTIHYYRLLGYGLLFFLAVASAGAAWLWDKAAVKKVLLAALVLIGLAALAQYLYLFRFTGEVSTVSNNNGFISVNQMTDIDYFWSISQYPDFGQANQMLSDLRNYHLLDTPQRIMPDMAPLLMMHDLSSVHFFNAALPLANDQYSLFGLYAESSWQLPFIFPATNPVTGNGMLWGRVRDLSFDNYFLGQGLEDMVKRLQLFGVNYLLTGSPLYDGEVQKIKEATLVKQEGDFKLYHLQGAKQMAYAPGHGPGLFVQVNGLGFREFALGWYSVPGLLDYPVADWNRGTNDLTKEAVAPFGYLVLDLSSPPPAGLMAKVLSFGKPILVLNESNVPLGLGNGNDVREIDGFQSVALFSKEPPTMIQPNQASLTGMTDFIRKYAAPAASSSAPTISGISDRKVSLYGHGPAIVNLGYFPYWHCTSGCSAVYPVTPGQMLVFANGETDLSYIPGIDTRVGLWLSILGLAGVAAIVYLQIREKHRR
ncbi:6-pyruvoyl-tetrahydropterin synthase-related protein [Patescibacteria group bacterium]|nr:6-pyruvoyl-tetrahydropterin synthase-related protein [Patescibacteria group bacterium]